MSNFPEGLVKAFVTKLITWCFKHLYAFTSNWLARVNFDCQAEPSIQSAPPEHRTGRATQAHCSTCCIWCSAPPRTQIAHMRKAFLLPARSACQRHSPFVSLISVEHDGCYACLLDRISVELTVLDPDARAAGFGNFLFELNNFKYGFSISSFQLSNSLIMRTVVLSTWPVTSLCIFCLAGMLAWMLWNSQRRTTGFGTCGLPEQSLPAGCCPTSLGPVAFAKLLFWL